MSETEPTETKPKKTVSRNIAIALGIICIILIASTLTVITLFANITQKYNQQNTIAQTWENDRAIPNNLDSLFQNKIVIWKNRQVTEPNGENYNFTFLNYFNYTGCLLINITSSNSSNSPVGSDSIGIIWHATSSDFLVNYRNITFAGNDLTTDALFPVLPSDSLDVFIGNMGPFPSGIYNVTQTVTLSYYY